MGTCSLSFSFSVCKIGRAKRTRRGLSTERKEEQLARLYVHLVAYSLRERFVSRSGGTICAFLVFLLFRISRDVYRKIEFLTSCNCVFKNGRKITRNVIDVIITYRDWSSRVKKTDEATIFFLFSAIFKTLSLSLSRWWWFYQNEK